MKKTSVLIVVGLLLIIQSCIPSLHPLYTSKDLIKDANLLGNWVSYESNSKGERSNGEQWEIKAKKKGEGYELVHQMDNKSARFILNYLKLEDRFYFDFYPDENEGLTTGKSNEFYEMHRFPVHTFAKVELKGNQMKVYRFNMDWLSKLFKQRKIRIKHEYVNDGYILTASTRELQAFVKKYADEEAAFVEPLILEKQ